MDDEPLKHLAECIDTLSRTAVVEGPDWRRDEEDIRLAIGCLLRIVTRRRATFSVVSALHVNLHVDA